MMQQLSEKLEPIRQFGAEYPLRVQLFAVTGFQMGLLILLWIIPPPITAPFDIASLILFAAMALVIWRHFESYIRFVKYWILMHLFILILYLLVYEVIFNWIIIPGKKEQSLSIWKIFLILISCIVDAILYYKWHLYREQLAEQTSYPEQVTTDNGYVTAQSGYQAANGQNY